MSSYTDFSKPELANSPRPLRLAQGQVLYFAGAYGNLWRVCKGALRIDRSARDMDNLINIALAGDLLGVEALCAEPYVGTATAVVDCVVLPEPVPDEAARAALLASAFLQQQRHSFDMAMMRTGTMAQRLAHLLALLGQSVQDHTGNIDRKSLPILRDMARILDAAHETVCRELGRIAPERKPRRAEASDHRPRGAGVPMAAAC